MRKLAFTISLLLLAGCISSQFSYSHKKVVKYLKKNPEVAPDIQTALHENRLEIGMNMTEVKLCWGEPTSVTVTEPPDPLETVWKYTKSDNVDKRLDSSPFWERQIPLYTATFGPNSLLATWHIYGKTKVSKATASRHINSRSSSKAASRKKTSGTTSSAKNISSQDYADPDDIAHWPALTFTSILMKGKLRSVIINGQILDEGDQILGIKILKIESDGAKMQYGKEIQFLKKGVSTR